MGHRKSHHRETKEGSLDHIKVKNVAQESAHGSSKQEKRSHRRKREYDDDDSSRRHKERHKRSHSSLKSSRKGKPRDKMHKRKGIGNSGSDSGSSFLSIEGAHKLSGRTHHSGAGVVSQHPQSTKTDLNDAGHRKHSSKRVRLSNENPSSHDALIKPSSIREDELQVKKSELGKTGQYTGVSSRSNLSRSERDITITKGREEGMDLEGKKDKILEVELRQKALANFMRHQDGTLRTEEHPMSDGEARQPDTLNEGEERVKVKVDRRQIPVKDNFVNINASEDVKRWPGSSVTVAPSSVDCSAEENANNLEEGEIESDNETEEEKESSAVDKAPNKNVEGNLHSIKENFEKQYELKRTNGMEVEGAGGNASQCVNLKQDAAQEKPGKGNADAHPASAQSNSSDNLQEKTMSVMRGGEMVQVSYKVYIPQRAAELARRRLQR